MHREFAEDAIVVVKRIAEEGRVTYRRIKLTERAKESGGEGWTMLR